MTNILAIYKRELLSYFVSPVAYGIIAGFLIISGFLFYGSLTFFLDFTLKSIIDAQQYQTTPPPVNVNDMVIRPIFSAFSLLSLFMLSMVTMRLFAEEKKMMTIELLFTSPVTSLQTILGKFFAALTLYIIMLIPTSLYFIILAVFGNPEILPVFTGYFGLLLLGAVFTSVGLLISSFTENQLVAVFLTFSALLLLWVIDLPTSIMGQTTASYILTYISLPAHFDDFTKGVIDSRHCVYYISVVILSLYLTHRSLESMRWRS